MSPSLLAVEELGVSFPPAGLRAIEEVSFSLEAGETLGIVGAPASGKTILALTMLGLVRPKRADVVGAVRLEGRDLLALTTRELRRLRGNELSLILHDSLDPFHTIGWQIAEAILEHHDVSRSAARDRAIDAVEAVGISEPHRRVDQYPHQLSDTMRERTMIAIATVNDPRLLIVDEPFGALGEAGRQQIGGLLREVQLRLGAGLLVLGRDRAGLEQLSDHIEVMRSGRIYSSST